MFSSVVLPLPDGPEHDDELASVDAQVDVLERGDRDVADVVAARDAVELDYGRNPLVLRRDGFRGLLDCHVRSDSMRRRRRRHGPWAAGAVRRKRGLGNPVHLEQVRPQALAREAGGDADQVARVGRGPGRAPARRIPRAARRGSRARRGAPR